jgi:phage terminase small subunit
VTDTPTTERTLSQETIRQIEALSPRKRRYIAGRLLGKSKYSSARDAGYSRSVAKAAKAKIEIEDVTQALQSVLHDLVPIQHLARRLAEGLDATETETFLIRKDGEKSRYEHFEKVNWAERRQYAALIAKLIGVKGMGGTFDPDDASPKVIVHLDC